MSEEKEDDISMSKEEMRKELKRIGAKPGFDIGKMIEVLLLKDKLKTLEKLIIENKLMSKDELNDLYNKIDAKHHARADESVEYFKTRIREEINKINKIDKNKLN